MQGEILEFKKDIFACLKLLEKRSKEKDVTSTLNLLHYIKNEFDYPQVYQTLAEIYSKMKLYELSNKHWFYLLDKSAKDRVGEIYENLSINYFKLNDVLSSTYYLGKKIETEGAELRHANETKYIEFFSQEQKGADIRLIHPIEMVDFSKVEEQARQNLDEQNFQLAKEKYLSIPKEKRTIGAYTDLCFTLNVLEEYEESIKSAKDCLAVYGENTTAYVALSYTYNHINNKEKSEYFYQKALQCSKDKEEDVERLVYCAVDRGDDKNARKYLDLFIKRNSFDLEMRFFSGICYLNLGDFKKAYSELSYIYQINPESIVYGFYANLAGNLLDGKDGGKNYLPLSYEMRLPTQLEKAYKDKIKGLVNEPSKIRSKLRKEEYRKILSWGLTQDDLSLARDCVYLLSVCFNDFSIKLMLNALLQPSINLLVKKAIVYGLVVCEYKKPFGIVLNTMYHKIKQKKLAFKSKGEDSVFLCAYALALTEIVLTGMFDTGRICREANMLYQKLKGKVLEYNISREELATLILSNSERESIFSKKQWGKTFDVSPKRIEFIKSLME